MGDAFHPVMGWTKAPGIWHIVVFKLELSSASIIAHLDMVAVWHPLVIKP